MYYGTRRRRKVLELLSTVGNYDAVVVYASAHGFVNLVRRYDSLAQYFTGRGIIANHIGGLSDEPLASNIRSGKLAVADVSHAQAAIYGEPRPDVEAHTKLNVIFLHLRMMVNVLCKIIWGQM